MPFYHLIFGFSFVAGKPHVITLSVSNGFRCMNTHTVAVTANRVEKIMRKRDQNSSRNGSSGHLSKE